LTAVPARPDNPGRWSLRPWAYSVLTLPIANLLHRKLRSALCAAAVGIGIAMLVVQLSLSHGMLNEVAERMQSVDAELIVLPKHANVIFQGGTAFGDGYAERIAAVEVNGRPVVRKVIPVFLDTIRLGGQQQRIFGVDPDDMQEFLGARSLLAGTLFPDARRFKNRLEQLRGDRRHYDPEEVSDDEIRAASELIIDRRLASVGNYHVGDRSTIFGREFRIVAIVESGVAGRVFAPLQTLRHILNGGVPWSSMFFVKLQRATDTEAAAAAIADAVHQKVELKSEYGNLLRESFAQIYTYMNIASGVALAVCFLFIMLTMYTLVLARTREIGVLKSLGASRRYLLAMAVSESTLICAAGTALGIGVSYVVRWAIEGLMPLATVQIQARWLLLGAGVGLLGGAASALYPGLKAARLDPATALAFE
jgi:putative ABC transport system permease protein